MLTLDIYWQYSIVV